MNMVDGSSGLRRLYCTTDVGIDFMLQIDNALQQISHVYYFACACMLDNVPHEQHTSSKPN